MPSVDLFRAVEHEPDGRAVAVGRRPAVDRWRDHEHRAPPAIAQAPLFIAFGFLAEDGIIETLRSLEVVRSDHHMAEHSPPSSIDHDGANALASMHQVEPLVDVAEFQHM